MLLGSTLRQQGQDDSFLIGTRNYHSKSPFWYGGWCRENCLDDILAKFDNHIVAICYCCAVPSKESIQNVFVESEPAIYLWKLFGAPWGIVHRITPLGDCSENGLKSS